jgi:hypothetical protein
MISQKKRDRTGSSYDTILDIDRIVVVLAHVHVAHLILGIHRQGMVLDMVKSSEGGAAGQNVGIRNSRCNLVVHGVDRGGNERVIAGCLVEIPEREVRRV